ncbi:gamma-glutamyl hydrolase [Drosophila guanche]|uniref:folate gamma-glutamyl hydrolase n=1 Tax=Drosophila guanche TaxID=7266 RepID=A0A3B0KPD9_DROGU|nr:gamma-glutamyl hydrolase [Drosophila guanche]SPP87021.1 blast:Gamma-glutamyl hydrolase [Drosophila guanche]
MQPHRLFGCVLVLGSLLLAASADSSPIIGVLTQEVFSNGLISQHFENKTSYIAASYVKYLESAGARVVPIWIGRNRSYYEDLMHKINGVLLPGGATWFNQTNGYADAGEHLLQLALQLNDNGTFMPVWGTCLGMELLAYKLANGTDHRINCRGTGMALPMELKEDYKQSRLFNASNEAVVALMVKENVTYHWHQFCYTEADFARNLLNKSWRVVSVNSDLDGIEFISAMEHTKYPFYGVQFHPEKPLFEFVKPSIPHSPAAVLSGQYFADFFVNEARKSPQSFANATEEARVLIYNYKPEYTSILGSTYVQQYLFTDKEMQLEEIGFEGGDDGDDGPSYFPPGHVYGDGNGAAAFLSLGTGPLLASLALRLFSIDF